MIAPAILACAPEGGGPPSYTGPLDLVPGAVVAYSQRAMAAAWVSNAITIRRDSDDATQSFATTTDNAVDVAAVSAFIGGGSGFVSSWNDQSGNADDGLQATSSEQPGWSATSAGGKPALIYADVAFPGAPNKLATFGNVTLPNGESYTCMVGKLSVTADVNWGAVGLWGMNGDSGHAGGYAYVEAVYNPGTTAMKPVCDTYDETNEAGARFADVDLSTGLVLIECFFAFGSHTWLINGVSIAEISDLDFGGTVGPIVDRLTVGVEDAIVPGASWQGPYAELLIWPTIPSAPQRLAIRQNIAAYYGITLS